MSPSAKKKTFLKILSSLIVLTALNTRLFAACLYSVGRIGAPMPALCRIIEAGCRLAVIYLNFFPLFTTRKVSTARNKILEDGIALLQIFLATTAIEILLCLGVFLLRIPVDAGTGILFSPASRTGALLFRVRYLLLAFLTELILFWNGIIRVYAISACGAADLVASLTTINTPHRGCIFADYLLDKIPDRVCRRAAAKYNAALSHFGDPAPDFLAAVNDLTASSCRYLNAGLPDSPQVYYRSVGSKMNRAAGGRFPLNMVYPLVKHFDGDCDGLVSVDSMKWGNDFIFLSVPSGRGVSHGDMIDLNRENIPGFDVREFYVNLVHNLKEMGF